MLSGYKVTVEGQYFVSAGNKQKTLSQYKLDVNLPTMDRALSIIKGKILDLFLPKKYPDYSGYRTHQITNVVAFGNVAQAKAVLWQMNRPTILSYIKENELPVNDAIYDTLMELREAVELAETDPDRFLRFQASKEKDYKLTSQLRELNPDFYTKDEEDAPVELEATPSGLGNTFHEHQTEALKEDVLATL